MNDNRKYDYAVYPGEKRDEYGIISQWIREEAKVLDLGCGNGSLIGMLQSEKRCACKGIELSASGVEACLQQGLEVRQGRIDEALPFADNSFDYAVCNVTIQMVMYPEILLNEMKRVAERQVVSFPNFAYFKNRLDLLLNGRMPRQLLFGYNWYDTGHIHQLSLDDFHRLVQEAGGLRITRRSAVPVGFAILDQLGKWLPNLFQKIIVVETAKQ